MSVVGGGGVSQSQMSLDWKDAWDPAIITAPRV